MATIHVETIPTQTYYYERKPIKLRNRGSRYARILYDLDGNVLKDKFGVNINVYTVNIRTAFEEGSLRLIRKLSDPGYSYFVTSEEQLQRFEEERDLGTSRYNNVYHVYADEDVDWDSPITKRLFVTEKKSP